MMAQIGQATARQKGKKRKVKMAIIQQPLKEWATREREARNWSIRELAERTASPHSSIRRAFNDEDRVGVEVCIRLAKVFNKPVYDVLEMAGWRWLRLW